MAARTTVPRSPESGGHWPGMLVSRPSDGLTLDRIQMSSWVTRRWNSPFDILCLYCPSGGHWVLEASHIIGADNWLPSK